MNKFILLAASVAALSGCSSIIEGTSQELVINTSPENCDCALEREGQIIGRVTETPGGITVKKTKHDITVICKKKGYETAKYFNKSEVAGATVANVILGGGIGWAIDSANGADNKYTTPMNITLSKK